MENNLFTKGNLTTFATWIYILISPLLVQYGIDIDQTAFTSFVVALVGIIIAVYSSKNPNTLSWLGNSESITTTEEADTNDEQ